jgi:hypothetical protein
VGWWWWVCACGVCAWGGAIWGRVRAPLREAHARGQKAPHAASSDDPCQRR